MIDTTNEVNRKIRYDYIKEKEWAMNLVAYGRPTGVLYRVYGIVLLCVFYYIQFMAMHAIYLAAQAGELEIIIGAIHVIVAGIFFLWGLTTRLLTNESMERAREMMNNGFFRYQDEEVDDEQIRMLEEGVKGIRSKCQKVLYVMVFGIASNMFIFPFSQYNNVKEHKYEEVVDIDNPYLPHSMHTPFSTRTLPGFMGAYFFNAFFQIGINMVTVTMNEVYVSTWGQLGIQLQILNYSLRNIQRRAQHLYKKRYHDSTGELNPSWDDSQFQECLYICLRSNVLHHLQLLKFRDNLSTYSGSCLLVTVLIASLAFACNLAMVVVKPPPNLLIHYVFVLIGEQFYAFFICYTGEKIMQESADLFESLYAVPWFNCSRRFCKMLRIFMAYTKEPIRAKCLVIEATASLDTYGTFLSTMYKIVNVLRSF